MTVSKIIGILSLVCLVSFAVVAQPPLGPLQKEIRYSPYNAVQMANEDIVSVFALQDLALDPHDMRYLSMHNIPPAERKELKAVVDFVLNSLNPRYRQIKRTATLPALAANPVVIRVNLADYGISRAAWDDLLAKGSGAVPIPEPYFQIQLKKNRFGLPIPKTRRPYAAAPWLALEPQAIKRGSTVANLIQMTNTANPIARADWFVTYATWAPAYYRLIGLELKDNPNKAKNQKVFLEADFEKLFKFKFADSRDDIVAAIADSKIVTLHNRILQRFSTVVGVTGGYYWRSQDTDTGIDAEDYLNNISTFDRPKIKAQEIITSGRNGLNFYALTDANRVLLNVAAANIAIHGDDMPTRFKDKQVFSARNCMLCHANGQILIRDKVRSIARGKIALLILNKTKDHTLSRKIEEAFHPDTKAIIDLDNAKFQASVFAAAGIDGRAVGKSFEKIVYNYYDQSISAERMAWEAGIDSATLIQSLKKGRSLDYTLVGVLQDPPELPFRLAWERQGFAGLMEYLISINVKE